MRKLFCVMTFIVLLGAATSCSAKKGAGTPSGIPLKEYKLVWSDEFNGTTLDMTKWNYRYLGPRRD